jgi:hypothetical protein
MSEIEFTDRYKATGTPYPDTETMCEGQCEGMGRYPQWMPPPGMEPKSVRPTDDCTEEEKTAWLLAHKDSEWDKEHGCDGYHFILCPDCKGTGKR